MGTGIRKYFPRTKDQRGKDHFDRISSGGEASRCELGGHPEGHQALSAFAQGELSDKTEVRKMRIGTRQRLLVQRNLKV